MFGQSPIVADFLVRTASAAREHRYMTAGLIIVLVSVLSAACKPAKRKRDTWASHVSKHGDLEHIGGPLYAVSGTLKSFSLPRRMVLYKLPSGGLLVQSAVAVNDDVLQKILALGQVRTPCRRYRA